jgi:hypothetical protein
MADEKLAPTLDELKFHYIQQRDLAEKGEEHILNMIVVAQSEIDEGINIESNVKFISSAQPLVAKP